MIVAASTFYFGDSVGFINGIGILIVIIASFRFVQIKFIIFIFYFNIYIFRYSLVSLQEGKS